MAILKEEFIATMITLLGESLGGRLTASLAGDDALCSVRLNAAKRPLTVDGDTAVDTVPWCALGRYLPSRPPFTFDPLFHAGAYYVQEASSMFIAHVLRTLAGTDAVTYLDVCAAPGGKTTAALDALPDGSFIVANDIVTSRARLLADNIVKWGNSHVAVTNAAPADFGSMTHAFDIVAADVPCSGEGMMRKDEKAAEQWSPALVAECAVRQRRIIDDVWNALRPGGLFIYSTCTFNRQENEEVVEYIVERYGGEPLAVPVDASWGIIPGLDTALPCYRFLLGITRGEGLFMAAIRKPDAPRAALPAERGRKVSATPMPAEVRNMLSDIRLTLIAEGDTIRALPDSHRRLLALLAARTKPLVAGLEVATIKGRGKLTPSHSLAMATALDDNAFRRVELDYATAIAYLRGEAVTIDAPRGLTIVTRHRMPLGFVNNLGSRANNMYPKSLRIMSTYAPDVEPHVL